MPFKVPIFTYLFQTSGPSGDKLTSLGTYLLICLVFVFFTIVEFALVLLVHENAMRKAGISKEGSKSEERISKHNTQVQKNVGKVSPFGAIQLGQKETGGTQRRRIIFLANRATFFEKLPLTRKIDFSAFVMYHFLHLLFNFIYWF